MCGNREIVPSSKVTAAVLAGGASRRFGTDKALAELPGTGTPLIERIIETARRVADRVVIVAPDRPAYRRLEIELIPDSFPGAGPGGGLVTALTIATTEYLVVLSCDQPLVEPRDLGDVISACGVYPAAAFQRADDGIHPLPCALRVVECRQVAVESFQRGDRSLAGLLLACGVWSINAPSQNGSNDRLVDVDSRADLRRLKDR